MAKVLPFQIHWMSERKEKKVLIYYSNKLTFQSRL